MKNEIITWFKTSSHKITLLQSNKENKVVAFTVVDGDSYCSAGMDEIDALSSLRKMLSKEY
jgi:hypothetical protein